LFHVRGIVVQVPARGVGLRDTTLETLMTFRRLSLVGALALSVGVAVGCGSPGAPVQTTGGTAPEPVYAADVRPAVIQLVADPSPLPALSMQDLEGRTITSDDLRGKVVLVNFWATWCGPCRAEIPDLVKLQDRYPDHLQIIGVSADEGPVQVVEDFATEYGINYPIVMATPQLSGAFPGVMALPTSFVVDPEGRVVQTHVGLINPGVIEQETRFLASLDASITVDLVEEDLHGRLVNAAQATEIPGLDLTTLTPEQRTTALQRLNTEGCTCGCQLTLAQCRINDSSCGFSLPLAEQLVAGIVGDPS
jgi:thiol-disulfide isomerase/thioredoxin